MMYTTPDNEPVLISVIMAAYNAEKYIQESVESVLAQTMGELELIIVDDGSTDGTAGIADRVAAKDTRVRVLHQRNLGVSAARNAALAVSCGGLVAIIDSDDLWHPEKLDRQLQTLQKNQSPCLVLAGTRRFADEDGKRVWLAESLPPEGSSTAEYFRRLLMLPNNRMQLINTALIPAGALRKAGGWRAGLSIAEDWDLWLRLAPLLPARNVMEPLYFYRKHAVSTTRQAGTGFALDTQLLILRNNAKAGLVSQREVLAAVRRKYLEFAELFRWCGNFGPAWQCTGNALFSSGWFDLEVYRSVWRCLTEDRDRNQLQSGGRT